MPNLKSYKVLAPEQQFLALPDHYVNVTAKIAFANLSKLAKDTGDGQGAVIHRGTLVNLNAAGEIVPCDSTANAEKLGNAIIFDTIKPASFDSGVDDFINAAALVHGFVRADRITLIDVATNKVANKIVASNIQNQMIYVLEK